MQTVTHLKEFQDKPQFFWDFWQIYNHKKQDFDVLVLHAKADLVADEKHHFSSAIAHCKTQDFKVMYDVSLNVFQASTGWDNTSIWSGDVIWYKDKYFFFYTSRNIHDFYTQHIGLAVSDDMLNWSRKAVLISADPTWYMTSSDSSENSIHAWRDPFIFEEAGSVYMLLGAKVRNLPANQRGAVAILRAVDTSLLRWEVLPSLYAPGCFGEIELPQLYKNESNQNILCFNSHAKHDTSMIERKGGLYALNLTAYLLNGKLIKSDLKMLASTQETGAYGFRIIPELDGVIVGFDTTNGGMVNTGIHTNFRHAGTFRYLFD